MGAVIILILDGSPAAGGAGAGGLTVLISLTDITLELA